MIHFFKQPIFNLCFFCFCLLVLTDIAETKPEPEQLPASGEFLGDYYYQRSQFQLAQIEYDRQLLKQKRNGKADSNLSSRQALTLMQQKRWNESIAYLMDNSSFTQLYLRMYASLRMGYINRTQIDQERIQKLDSASATQKDLASLLNGAIHLEYGHLDRARQHYDRLHKQSDDSEVQLVAGRVLTSLQGYESLNQKSPLLAGALSTLIPGAGQIYAEHYVDGGVAFFFNAMFLGSALVMYDLENQADRPHTASLVTGLIGVSFYISNILGGYNSAHRYNRFQQRKFHQDIRRHFFRLEFVQKTSGVEFKSQF